jgi:hypothetical protein
MFLDCPAYLDRNSARRCGLPAEVTCRYMLDSTDGPMEGAMIRCPAGHYFNGPVELLALDYAGHSSPGPAGVPSDSRADRKRKVSLPNGAPSYYQGRPAALWINAMRPRRGRPAAVGRAATRT